MILTSEQIKSAVSGAVRYGSDGKYISFYRFTEEQEELFSAGYRKDSTSGACVIMDFETDASSLSLNWRIKKNLAGGRLLNDLCIDGLYAASFGIDGDNTACGSGDFSICAARGYSPCADISVPHSIKRNRGYFTRGRVRFQTRRTKA